MKLPSPESLPDFMTMFGTEEACEDYLYDLRWPDGFVCPGCGSTNEPYWIDSQRKVECAACGEHTYLTADRLEDGLWVGNSGINKKALDLLGKVIG